MITDFESKLNDIFLLENIVLPSGDIKLTNINMIANKSWDGMVRDFRRKGYDMRTPEEVKDFFGRVSGQSAGLVKQSIWGDHVAILTKYITPTEKKVKTPEEEIFYRTARYFGYTDDLIFAGYILPNGKMLDLSGRNRGNIYARTRSEDHRTISEPLDKLSFEHPVQASGTSGMEEFIKLGAIRMDANSGLIHIAKEPTLKQYRTLNYFVRFAPSEGIYIDLDGGTTPKESHSLEEHDRRKTIGVIKNYFKG